LTRQQLFVRQFLERCGVEQHVQHLFLLAAEKILPAYEMQVNELSGKMRRSVLEKVPSVLAGIFVRGTAAPDLTHQQLPRHLSENLPPVMAIYL